MLNQSYQNGSYLGGVHLHEFPTINFSPHYCLPTMDATKSSPEQLQTGYDPCFQLASHQQKIAYQEHLPTTSAQTIPPNEYSSCAQISLPQFSMPWTDTLYAGKNIVTGDCEFFNLLDHNKSLCDYTTNLLFDDFTGFEPYTFSDSHRFLDYSNDVPTAPKYQNNILNSHSQSQNFIEGIIGESKPNNYNSPHNMVCNVEGAQNSNESTLPQDHFLGIKNDLPFSASPSAVSYEKQSCESYARLIYRALMSAPNYRMALQEIYQWFRENTCKGTNESESGWKNSIRHNLSMNAAFKKFNQNTKSNKSRKSTEWTLEPFAIKEGVQSTTRYRKNKSLKIYRHRLKSCTPDRIFIEN